MRDDFAAFILTHGRPDRVYTYQSLLKAGYTGKIYLVIDDEDAKGDEYRKRFGDKVLTFCKRDVASWTDSGDNSQDYRVILYARNACFALAQQVGVRYFIELDDDYTDFAFRRNARLQYVERSIKSTMDQVLTALVQFLIDTPFASVAMSQSGDFIGGKQSRYARQTTWQRKAMNSFICDTHRPFVFAGRLNEDVNSYTAAQRRNVLFLTSMQVSLKQKQTQSNAGGMTDVYLASGTYVKSFFSVMYAPSAVKVNQMQSTHKRLHHSVSYNACAAKILSEHVRKSVASNR